MAIFVFCIGSYVYVWHLQRWLGCYGNMKYIRYAKFAKGLSSTTYTHLESKLPLYCKTRLCDMIMHKNVFTCITHCKVITMTTSTLPKFTIATDFCIIYATLNGYGYPYRPLPCLICILECILDVSTNM